MTLMESLQIVTQLIIKMGWLFVPVGVVFGLQLFVSGLYKMVEKC